MRPLGQPQPQPPGRRRSQLLQLRRLVSALGGPLLTRHVTRSRSGARLLRMRGACAWRRGRRAAEPGLAAPGSIFPNCDLKLAGIYRDFIYTTALRRGDTGSRVGGGRARGFEKSVGAQPQKSDTWDLHITGRPDPREGEATVSQPNKGPLTPLPFTALYICHFLVSLLIRLARALCVLLIVVPVRYTLTTHRPQAVP